MNPSTHTEQAFLQVENPYYPKEKLLEKEKFKGRWLIFCTPEQVDDLWLRISQAVKLAEIFSIAAKVSTAKRLNAKKTDHVIHVFTQDYRNANEIGLCLQDLRNLNVQGDIVYKANNQNEACTILGLGGNQPWLYSSLEMEEDIVLKSNQV